MVPDSLGLDANTQALIRKKLMHTLDGIEATIEMVGEASAISVSEMRSDVESLEAAFLHLFQKWNLAILYTVFLKKSIGFGEIKKTLGVNSRTLSDKLRQLAESGYISRGVIKGPPLRVEYTLTKKGRNTVLLALPLIYSLRDDQV